MISNRQRTRLSLLDVCWTLLSLVHGLHTFDIKPSNSIKIGGKFSVAFGMAFVGREKPIMTARKGLHSTRP